MSVMTCNCSENELAYARSCWIWKKDEHKAHRKSPSERSQNRGRSYQTRELITDHQKNNNNKYETLIKF